MLRLVKRSIRAGPETTESGNNFAEQHWTSPREVYRFVSILRCHIGQGLELIVMIATGS